MPISSYETEDPFDNHPLFKSEEQARLEETMDGTEPAVQVAAAAHPWPGEDTLEPVAGADRASGAAPATSTGATRRGGTKVPPRTPPFRTVRSHPRLTEKRS